MANLRGSKLAVVALVFMMSVVLAKSSDTSYLVQKLRKLLEQRENVAADLPPENKKEGDAPPLLDNLPVITDGDIFPEEPPICHGVPDLIKRLEGIADHFDFLLSLFEEEEEDSEDSDGSDISPVHKIPIIGPGHKAANAKAVRMLLKSKLRGWNTEK